MSTRFNEAFKTAAREFVTTKTALLYGFEGIEIIFGGGANNIHWAVVHERISSSPLIGRVFAGGREYN